MKLNPDCIRAVMIEIENSLEIGISENDLPFMGIIGLHELSDALPEYSKEDIFYTIFTLEQAGYLSATIKDNISGEIVLCYVHHMTFAGHEFLDKIRDTQNWTKVKKGMNAIRNYSLDAITALAEGIANAAIAAALKEIGS